jgi:RNA polymerase sigma-70 factor (ECF subfamily)
MTAVQQGNFDAFDYLVRRHHRAVYNTICHLLGDLTEAEDLTQQTFLRIYQSSATYTPTAKFTTWMFTILRNLVFNEMRRRQRKPTSTLEHADDQGNTTSSLADTLPSPEESPHEATLRVELEDQIQSALQSLPENQRLAILLMRNENLSYEEIASVLETSVSSVKSLIFRARESLRERLNRYLNATETSPRC